jgi:hypothetical protein
MGYFLLVPPRRVVCGQQGISREPVLRRTWRPILACGRVVRSDLLLLNLREARKFSSRNKDLHQSDYRRL